MVVSDSQYQFIIDSVNIGAEAPKVDPSTQVGEVYDVVQANPTYEWTVENVQVGAGTEPSNPTGMSPAVSNWPGTADFKVNFMRLSDNPKHETWEVRRMSHALHSVLNSLFSLNSIYLQFSKELNKLYINMANKVKIGFTTINIAYEG